MDADLRRKRSLGRSLISKRTVTVDGHKTSVGMEEPFWTAFKEIAAIKKMPIRALLSEIANSERPANLSSAIRLYVLKCYRDGVRMNPPLSIPVDQLNASNDD
jgi:predicted DNA-binding ribbon-helix-helix protein